MGMACVAVYSECDRAARHVRMADEALCNWPQRSRLKAILRVDRLIDAAQASGADAVHPGYGFLAENESFAAACRAAGLTFIGPTAEAISLMGSKTAARRAAIAAGVPVVPGSDAPFDAESTGLGNRGGGGECRVSAAHQGRCGRRWQGHAGGDRGRRPVELDSRGPVRGSRRLRRSRYLSGTTARPAAGTWRCSCSATCTAMCCRSSSVNVRSNAGTRKSLKKRRRLPYRRHFARRSRRAAAARGALGRIYERRND